MPLILFASKYKREMNESNTGSQQQTGLLYEEQKGNWVSPISHLDFFVSILAISPIEVGFVRTSLSALGYLKTLSYFSFLKYIDALLSWMWLGQVICLKLSQKYYTFLQFYQSIFILIFVFYFHVMYITNFNKTEIKFQTKWLVANL